MLEWLIGIITHILYRCEHARNFPNEKKLKSVFGFLLWSLGKLLIYIGIVGIWLAWIFKKLL